jgi:hypothetical protein
MFDKFLCVKACNIKHSRMQLGQGKSTVDYVPQIYPK